MGNDGTGAGYDRGKYERLVHALGAAQRRVDVAEDRVAGYGKGLGRLVSPSYVQDMAELGGAKVALTWARGGVGAERTRLVDLEMARRLATGDRDSVALDALRASAAEAAAMARFAKARDHPPAHIILACGRHLSNWRRDLEWGSAQSVLRIATLEASGVDAYLPALATRPHDPAVLTWRGLLRRYTVILTTFVTSPNIPLLRVNVKGWQHDLAAVAASLRTRADDEDRQLRMAEQRVRAAIERALGLAKRPTD